MTTFLELMIQNSFSFELICQHNQCDQTKSQTKILPTNVKLMSLYCQETCLYSVQAVSKYNLSSKRNGVSKNEEGTCNHHPFSNHLKKLIKQTIKACVDSL